MDWIFKDKAPEQGSSDGFWYDMTDGGYIAPEEVLQNGSQLEKLLEAVEVVKSFESALQAKGLLREF